MGAAQRVLRAWRAAPWPLPAALAWGIGWALWAAASGLGRSPGVALAAGASISALLAFRCEGRRRQAIAALGFPLSAAALGFTAAVSPWWWLLLLLPLVAVYPLRAWRDAPLYPTPPSALDGIGAIVGAPRRVLDAGCGLGHGLRALRSQWPTAELHGIEWSPVLAAVAALCCRDARVRRGDMWSLPWTGYDVVYLFQRPESMARAHAKAARELAPQAWLVSLEFPVPGQRPQACLERPGQRTVWIYRPADTAKSTDGPSTRAGSRR